jgi:hypothetical protein
MRIGRILGVWAMIAGLLFWNGALGLALFNPLFGREAGEMMTFFIAVAIIFGTSRVFLTEEPECTKAKAIRVSVLWMVLSLVFELGLGRVVGVFRPAMAPTYGMWDGSFWPLIVLSMGTAPIIWLRRDGLAIPRVMK